VMREHGDSHVVRHHLRDPQGRSSCSGRRTTPLTTSCPRWPTTEFGLKVLWDRDAVIADSRSRTRYPAAQEQIASQRDRRTRPHGTAPAQAALRTDQALRDRDPRGSARVGGGGAHQQTDRR
jgi:hypothetical protein